MVCLISIGKKMSEYWIQKMNEARAIQNSQEATDWVKANDRAILARNASMSILAVAALASLFNKKKEIENDGNSSK